MFLVLKLSEMFQTKSNQLVLFLFPNLSKDYLILNQESAYLLQIFLLSIRSEKLLRYAALELSSSK